MFSGLTYMRLRCPMKAAWVCESESEGGLSPKLKRLWMSCGVISKVSRVALAQKGSMQRT